MVKQDQKVQLLGNDFLFVPEVETKEAFLQALEPNCPTATALQGGGVVELHGTTVSVPAWSVGKVKPQPVVFKEGKKEVSGMAVRLRPSLAFLEMKYRRTNVKTNPFFMLIDFKRFLVQDMKQIVEDEVLGTRLPGLQAQMTEDLRLDMNEIGVSPKMGQAILEFLGVDCDTRNRKDADGFVCGALRYPWAGPKGGRNVILRVLPDLPDTKIAMHPVALEKYHQGDIDGDVGYAPFTHRSRYQTVKPVGPYPRIEGFNGDNPLPDLLAKFQETTKEEAVKQVMGACIKDLTGLLIYTQYCLGQAYSVHLGDKKKAMAEVLSVFVILVEAVMDCKKDLEKYEILQNLARGLCRFTSGGCLDPTIFHPFLDDEELRHKISLICRTVGSMVEIRKTLGGALVAGGRFRERVVEDVIAQLLEEDVAPEKIMRALIDDITLAEVRLRSVKGERDEDEPKEKPVISFTPMEKRGLTAIFESITVNGSPVFSGMDIRERYDDGTPKILFCRIRPAWLKQNSFTWNLLVELPQVAKLTPEGHALLTFSGRTSRVLRPFFYLERDVVEKGDLARFLLETLLDGVQALTESKLKSPNSAKLVEAKLNEVIRHHVNSLPESDPIADIVTKTEFEIKVPDDADILTGWSIREKILSHVSGLLGEDLEEEGEFNVQATKKGKPGTIVSRVGEHGVPDYILQVNPFARFMPAKRLVEMREMALSLPLAYPDPLPLQTKGYPIAEGLTKNFTMLRVAVFNCNLNHTEEFSHDTMLGCPSIKHKTTLAGLTFNCPTEEKVEMMRERLARFDITETEVIESEVDLDGGLVGKTYELRVNRPVEDIGKLKSLGAIKAVPVMVPYQLIAVGKDGVRREIDLVVSRETMVKKGCLDAALYMLHAEKEQEIDPKDAIDLNTLPEGMHTIIALYPEGEVELGTAMVGLLPFYRPMQTGVGLCDLRPKSRGIRIPHFGLPLVGWDHHVGKRTEAEMTDLCRVYRSTIATMTQLDPKKGGRREETQEEVDLHTLFPEYAA